jgi:hypothetical protein
VEQETPIRKLGVNPGHIVILDLPILRNSITDRKSWHQSLPLEKTFFCTISTGQQVTKLQQIH